ncbi:MAG TPA: hypothetical protein VM847_16255, partial [Tahibacter sp.]|nr:hypothetical protein [Tahibacter sp.]
MNRILTIALLAAAITGCHCTKREPTPAELRYCKHGASIAETSGHLFKKQDIVTDIRPPARDLLVSADESFFKIYLPHCTAGDIQPPWQKICLESGDAVTIAEANGIYHLELTRKGTPVASGDLQLAAEKLWLEGRAVLANPPSGQDPRVGTFYLYARPLQLDCRHTEPENRRECRSIFLEYFADNDTHSAKYRPTTSGTNPTVTQGI